MLNGFFVWLILYAATWLLWYFAIHKGWTYENSPVFAPLFFLGSGAAHFWFFSKILLSYFNFLTVIVFLLALAVILLANWFVYSYFHKHFSKTQDSWKMNYVGAWSKQWEIFFQQISFAVLFSVIGSIFARGPFISISVTAVVFFVLHLPALYFLSRFFAWYYSLFAIFGAILFAICLQYLPFGVVFAYILHSIFYTITVGIFWKRQCRFPVIR